MFQIDEIKSFIKKYDKCRNLTFCHLSPLPNSKIVQPFGFQCEDSKIFFNRGTYFSDYSSFLQKVITPFDIKKIEFYKDKQILELTTDYDFILRIYFVHEYTFSFALAKSLNKKEKIERDEFLCKSGLPKPMKKTSSYIEIISKDKDPSILHSILEMKYDSKKFQKDFSVEEISSFFDIHNIPKEQGIRSLRRQKEKESIKLMNSFCSFALDPLSNSYRYFYSFNALF